MKAYVDGQQVLTASDTLLASNTSAGLFSMFYTSNTFDNFKVNVYPPPGSESAIELLARTYRVKAENLISDAEATTVQDPKNQRKFDRELAEAYEELAEGDAERDAGDFSAAVDHYKKACEHASQAIEYAGGGGVEFTLDKKGKEREFIITDNGDGTYTITPAPDGKKDKLEGNTRIYLEGEEVVNIHTSCSKSIETGDVYGEFTIVSLEKLY